MMIVMIFNHQELELLQDTDFLLTKAKLLAKIQALLTETRQALDQVIADSAFPFPPGSNVRNGKISRGENYLGLPYRVLDHPSLFTSDDIFAYRTMFWWGHFFSATLHLQGASLEHCRRPLLANIEKLAGRDIYVSVGPTPWEYHYGPDNYAPLTVGHRSHLQSCTFLKLSRKIELDRWQELPGFAAGFLEWLLRILS